MRERVGLGMLFLSGLVLAVASRLDAQAAKTPPAHDHDHAARGAVDGAMSIPRGHAGAHLGHIKLTPVRRATRADSVRAMALADTIRRALLPYKDVRRAEEAGYVLFKPGAERAAVLHYTNWRRAFLEAFRFDAAKPTSLLYRKKPDGSLELLGAMYGAPWRMKAEKLDERVPLSIARWHQHVNLCLPKRKDPVSRWTERTASGAPVFGPESPIATKKECDAVQGQFREHLFGWMLHANVFAGTTLAEVWGEEH